MIPEVFLDLIEKSFNEEEKQVLVASLLQDARISQALEEIQRCDTWEAQRLSELDNWKPVYFALILSDGKNSKKDLKDLVKNLRAVSNTLSFDPKQDSSEPLTLRQAGEKALELHTVLQHQSWRAIEQQYFQDFQFRQDAGLVAACLIGLIEQTDIFIEQEISNSNQFEIKKMMCYALLCNAQPLDDLLRRCHAILNSLDEEEKIDMLRFLQQQGRTQIVRALISSDIKALKHTSGEDGPAKLKNELQEIQALNFSADLQLLMGDDESASKELERLIEKIDQIKNGVLQKKTAFTGETMRDPSEGKSQGSSAIYDWKKIPARQTSGELKRPALSEVDDVLCKLENGSNIYADDGERQVTIADYYQDLGDWKRAQNHLKIARILNPDNTGIEQKLLYLYIQNQCWEKASTTVKSLAQEDPLSRSFLPFYLELKTLLAVGKKEDVLRRLQGYPLETLHKDPQALFQAGTLYMELAEWERAVSLLEAARAEGNTDFSNWIALYQCFIKLQQLQKAENILTEALDLFKECKGFYEQLIPVLMDCGRVDQGLALIEKIGIEGADPNDIAGIIERLNRLSYQTCASEVAQKAIERYPLNASLGYQTAYAMLENGEHERASKLLCWSADERKEDPQYFTLKAVADLHSSMSKFPMGTDNADLNRLPVILQDVQKIPATDYWRNLIEAESYRLQGELSKAAEGYKKIILDNSLGENRAQLWRAQVGLAKTMLQAKQTETAITLLNEALRTQTENLDIYDLLAEAYRSCNLGEDAFQIAQQARLVCKKRNDITGWYVAQMLKLGKPDEVRTYFRQEEENLQSSPDFLFERMKFEHQFGDADQTARIMQDLVALENLSSEQLYTALQVAQALKQHELSLKIVQKLPKDGSNQAEMLFIEACIMWNDGEHAGAIQHLQSMGDADKWSALITALQAFYAFQEQETLADMEVILQSMGSMAANRTRIAAMPAHIRAIVPGQWLVALTEPQFWVKIAVLHLLEQPVSEEQYGALFSIINPTQIDILSQSYLLICDWLRNGKLPEGREWGDILGELEKTENPNQDVVFSMILNILMDEGNEIAAAEKLNALPIDQLPEKGTLFAKVRLLNRNGNRREALQLYRQVREQAESEAAPVHDLDSYLYSAFSSIQLWSAKSALELKQWQDAAAAYAHCLQYPPSLAFLKKCSLEGLLRICLNSWSYPSLEVHDEFSAGFYTMYQPTLHDQLDLLPADQTRSLQMVRDFLDGDELPELLEGELASGYFGRAVGIIQNCRKDAIQTAIDILGDGTVESDLVILAFALIPDEHKALLIPLVNSAIYMDKKNAYLYAALAKIFEFQGETELAIGAYENALGIMDDQTSWQMQLADLYERKGEIRKALSVAEKATQADPGNVHANKIYLYNLYQVHDYSTFIHHIEKVPNVFEGDTEMQRKLVTAYFETGQYRKSLSLLTRIVKDPEQDLEMLLVQAKIATRLGSIPKAMELIRKAYSLDPKDPQVIIELADIKSKEQNEEFGLEIIEKALQTNIQSTSLILEKARYLEKVRGKKRALDFIQAYVEATSDVPYEILNHYANLQIVHGDLAAALHALEASIQQEEFQPDVHIQIGKFCAQNGDLDKAVFHFDKAIHMAPENMQPYLQLVDVFLKRREAQRAESLIASALENCPEHYLIYEKASQVYNQLGDNEQSEQALRKAAALNPNDEALREKLGIILANRIFNKG